MTAQDESAPLHQVVGQLRELISKVPPGTWGLQNNNFGIGVMIRQPDDFFSVCWWDHESIYEHTEDCRALIVAAVNAIPALLAIAEAAAVVSAQRNGPYLMADMDATLKAESDLRTALSLLPNPKITGPAPEVSDD